MPTKRAWLIALLALASGPAVGSDDEAPLPMRTKAPIVYATPIDDMVILEFKLYDNRTWCRLYIARDAWEHARAHGKRLPAGADAGQLHCERR